MAEERADRRHRALGALLLCWVTLAVGVPSPARADANLAGSSPAHGTTLRERPETVTLDFTSPVAAPAQVAVAGPDGVRVESGGAIVSGGRVQQPVDVEANGDYTVVFHVVAQDGHAVRGSVRFTVDAPATVDASWWSQKASQVVGLGAIAVLGTFVLALRLRVTRTT